jgi:hypothetical protein
MWERSLVVLVSIAQIDLNLETAGITHLLGLDSISVYPSFMLKRSNCSRAAGRLAPHNAGHQATINIFDSLGVEAAHLLDLERRHAGEGE